MTASEIINKYIKFFESRGHKKIEGAPLVPQDDPTTLFTSSGMQPLIKYFLGEPHPLGKRIVDVQNCFRAQDIDEVGDNRHTTFFRMLGNWSFGDYFKKEQLPWFFEFLTEELNLDPKRLYVSVFEGEKELNIPRDEESAKIWENLFSQENIKPEGRIFTYGVNKNWWSRSGLPKDMPAGEPGGPDSEVFYDFGAELNIHENSKFKDQKCHINCDCGRYLEIGNSVFMQYVKKDDGSFDELPQKNVDFGGGLERLLAATENKPDIFQTSLYFPVVKRIEKLTEKDYVSNKRAIRIIADHLVASVFITANNIIPSNKEQGYILRRLLRRAIRYGKQLEAKDNFIKTIAFSIIENYSDTDPYLTEKKDLILNVFKEEEDKFNQVIQTGLEQSAQIFSKLIPIEPSKYSKLMQSPEKKELFRNIYRSKKQGKELNYFSEIGINKESLDNATLSGELAFNLYQSFGFPIEMIVELAQEKALLVDIESFQEEMKQHQELSREGAEKKFKGGLADESEKTIMGHTATHLLHKALRDLLGEKVRQTGSNITVERIRFDFAFDRKLTEDEIAKIEQKVNEKIKENLSVTFKMMSVEQAKKTGAIGLFQEKYENTVKVYFIGTLEDPYSAEFCGGPHVDFTGRLKRFKIIKQDNLGQGQKRIYAIVG